MSETLSIMGAARRASKSDRTIRGWIQAGHIEAIYDDKGKRRIVTASLDAYLAAQRQPPALEPSPETVAESLAGLPELVAELAKMRREINELQWQNGHLTAALDAARREVRLLEAGPEVAATTAEVPETQSGSLPETVAEVETGSAWERFKAWYNSRTK